MDLLNMINDYVAYIILGFAGIFLVVLIALIIQSVRISKLKKKYKSFMNGNDGASLEELITKRFQEIDQLKEDVTNVNEKMEVVSETLQSAYQKVGIVKYDAFREMGGKLSFVLAMLNDHNDGYIINCMHSSREGCYTYIKEILHGESFITLSDEEKEALTAALNKKNYME